VFEASRGLQLNPVMAWFSQLVQAMWHGHSHLLAVEELAQQGQKRLAHFPLLNNFRLAA